MKKVFMLLALFLVIGFLAVPQAQSADLAEVDVTVTEHVTIDMVCSVATLDVIVEHGATGRAKSEFFDLTFSTIGTGLGKIRVSGYKEGASPSWNAACLAGAVVLEQNSSSTGWIPGDKIVNVVDPVSPTVGVILANAIPCPAPGSTTNWNLGIDQEAWVLASGSPGMHQGGLQFLGYME